MAKAAAGREKDRGFCMALLQHRYVRLAAVLELVAAMPMDGKEQRALRSTIRRWAKAAGEAGHDIGTEGA